MNIHQATTSYERWVGSCIPLDRWLRKIALNRLRDATVF